ncbi:hypothetical protein ETB97_007001 [Aspergillus alliaceus]|uniref:SnoaL-like domain-containing protein n=1 Tax=Petromyces alliaceus TaxID=209559 RepID=A0A8H5ZTU2_PETAA|nr:hypothetical protein ETB97_007001 [Aspergillus burnettii]
MKPVMLVETVLVTSLLAVAWNIPSFRSILSAPPDPLSRPAGFSPGVSGLSNTVNLGLHPQDTTAIQQTLSLYPFIIDSGEWDQLGRVLHPDIWANYSSYVGILQGIDNVEAALKRALAHVTSQHALSTQVIDVAPDGLTAHSLTYYLATHWGKGKYFGQALWTWATYDDEWIKNPETGEWRIIKRTNHQAGPWFGNTAVLGFS